MATPPIRQAKRLYLISLKHRPKCILVYYKLIRITFTHLAQPALLRLPLGEVSLRPVDGRALLVLPGGFPDV